MTRRSLIIGATGQDGAYLAKLLCDLRHEVVGTSRTDHRQRPANLVSAGVDGVCLRRLDPLDALAVDRLLCEFEPDEIYYLAAQSSVGLSFEDPLQTWQASATGFVILLDSVRRHVPAARIVYAASGDCFGITRPDAPATEESRLAPRSPYAAAKCAGVHAARVARLAHDQFVSAAFLFSHESPLRSAAFATGKVMRAVRRIAGGSDERLRLGNLDVVRDWGWAPDYVQALRLMAAHEEPLELVIATGESRPLSELVARAFDAIDRDWRDHVDVDPAQFRPADIPEQHADPSAAAATLGWRARHKLNDFVPLLVEASLGSSTNQ